MRPTHLYYHAIMIFRFKSYGKRTYYVTRHVMSRNTATKPFVINRVDAPFFLILIMNLMRTKRNTQNTQKSFVAFNFTKTQGNELQNIFDRNSSLNSVKFNQNRPNCVECLLLAYENFRNKVILRSIVAFGVVYTWPLISINNQLEGVNHSKVQT